MSDEQHVWKGLWIAPGDWRVGIAPPQARPIAFRTAFELPDAPRAATLRVAAGWRYTLWINGVRAGHGPARSYPRRQCFDVLEVGHLLRAGANEFAAIVEPCTGIRDYHVLGRLGLFMDGEAACATGSVDLVTDREWRWHVADWYRATGHWLSLAAGPQEHLAEEPVGWTTEPCPDWPRARVLGDERTPPWESLEPRPLPLLQERALEPLLVWAGRAEAGAPDGINLAPWFNRLDVEGRRIEPGVPLDELSPGTGLIHTFDLGRTRLVRPRVQVHGARGRVRIELYYDIRFDGRPSAMTGFDAPEEGFVDTWRPPDGDAAWSPLAPRGARFVSVRVAGPGRVGRLSISVDGVDFPFADGARLETDDALLAGLWRVSADTLRSSASDCFVDTCSRENVCWTFDACVAAKAAFYTFGDDRLWRRVLQLVGQGISAEGRAPAVVPSDSFTELPAQTLYWAMSCADHLLATGDEALAREMIDPASRFLGSLEEAVTDDGLIAPWPDAWHWVDWAPLDTTAYSLPINALALLACRAVRRLAKAVEDDEQEPVEVALQARLEASIDRFWDDAAGAFRDHADARAALPYDNRGSFWSDRHPLVHSLHGNALALRAELASPDRRARAAAFIARRCAQEDTPRNRFTPGWTELLLAPLLGGGHARAAWEVVRRRYGGLIAAGAPTWPENFEPVAAHNTAHGWGASINTLIAERVVGLRPLQTGWRRAELQPAELGMGFRYELETAAGRWCVERGADGIAATVPRGAVLAVGGRLLTGTGTTERVAVGG